MANNNEIDDSLYSRQRYVLGDTAMQRMSKSSVLLCGLGGLGVEIAKNIILAGVKSFTVQDSKCATYHDLGSQFFLREEDVKSKENRAEACCERLAELNPYVPVKTISTPLDENTDLTMLTQYQCVILTEASLGLQLKVNQFCRSQSPPISFITADVYGVFCWSFCDFGDSFEVVDTNGEEPRDSFISKITKENPGVVTTMEDAMHGLEDGDHVTFKEIQGMTQLNGKTLPVKVLTPYKVSICDTSGDDFSEYQHGGVMCQIKTPKTVHFESLEKQLKAPALLTPDFSKLDAPMNIHIGMQALHRFQEQNGRLPNRRCNQDADAFVQICSSVNETLENKVSPMDETALRSLAHTAQGVFSPLCAALGGVVAQEAIKALSGKFTPLNQWLCFDACEVLASLESANSSSFQPKNNRYDALRTCVGEELCQKLANLKLFMVGCGAIGCEMLKNYATLGVASSQSGQITITDNDLIEKSNLNRQFLFRPHHIRKPKSTTAAQSTCDINPDVHIDAHQHKVCPDTENTVYTDAFFEQQNLVVNALDNLEARRYMDSRCVTNQRPLLESGTMGAKGHVQVIVPHVTESYSSQQDPVDHDVPYCTLKSFPAQIEHTIQWARDKFESSFSQKPSLFNKYWASVSSPQEVIEKLRDGAHIEGSVQVSKLSASRPADWAACVATARLKFEKYFNHKAKHLLHAFPLDTKLKDGSLFWQSPKRPPNPVEFDENNELHLSFVCACARLYAGVCGVKYSAEDVQPATLIRLVRAVQVPPYKPTSKKIETDESVQKEDAQAQSEVTEDELEVAANRFSSAVSAGKHAFEKMSPQSFEKDDDSNAHIDFITAASNLRASMYSIEQADRFKTKRIAGRIVPAIATTTAAVAGLVTVELVKLVKAAPPDHYKNCFLNLALPVLVFSEPGPVAKTTMTNGITFSLWDKWRVKGNRDFTVQQFIDALKEKYKVEASMIVQGVKMIYVPMMPGHRKRLAHPMLKYVKPAGDKPYVDLIVSYEGNEDDEMGPAVRYYHDA